MRRGMLALIGLIVIFRAEPTLADGPFDGVWTGPVTYTLRCGAGADMEWVIADNKLSGKLRGSLTQYYNGTVSSDGKVKLTVSNTSDDSRTAKFEKDHFIYRFKSTGCGLGSVRLYRAN